jgi:hypothetical protein
LCDNVKIVTIKDVLLTVDNIATNAAKYTGGDLPSHFFRMMATPPALLTHDGEGGR